MPDKDQLVTGYAQALFSVADAEGVLGSVEDELFAFAKALEQNAGLGQALIFRLWIRTSLSSAKIKAEGRA